MVNNFRHLPFLPHSILTKLGKAYIYMTPPDDPSEATWLLPAEELAIIATFSCIAWSAETWEACLATIRAEEGPHLAEDVFRGLFVDCRGDSDLARSLGTAGLDMVEVQQVWRYMAWKMLQEAVDEVRVVDEELAPVLSMCLVMGGDTFVLLTHTPKYIYWLFRRLRYHDHQVLYIPTRSCNEIRALVFGNKAAAPSTTFQPLHLHIHGGAFLGGLPEYDAPICAHIAEQTDAVVVATDYRGSPAYPFPAAVEDVEHAITWLHANARTKLNADPSRLTISGASAGGTLAYSAAQRFAGTEREIKGIVSLFTPVDLRIPPWQKRKPAGFPRFDITFPLQTLFDLYASQAREAGYAEDPRLSPTLADPGELPDDILMIVPTLDILLDEQLAFAEKLRQCEDKGVELKLFEGQLHGFIDLPSFMIGAGTRQKAFDAVAEFVRWVQHDGNGFR
ncbi:hypothetical protein LTR56_012318 [Elasticomyces elasticus]|nr:hypothetical protein LTR56_012318 [Elasticomyces elasticus]KAK3641274.1 hypothetical protein LTR22_016642 [Elasticomyces elasticus]KAK4922603.1 hypothetical protein LTR49_010130 [Elasticomyces elasticus]KAK5760776.1 hypothetical protein LTS12_009134 [Elasticomyces elasticus]